MCDRIVVGSQYRGGGGSEGKDEFGGDDLNDVINAILGRYTGNLQDVDYNGDGVVDVLDLNTIINVILGSNNP